MAQIPYRANLNTGHFPLLSEHQGRTVIIPGRDQAFSQTLFGQKDDDDRDKGMPQIYYCHNVMPSAEGLQSFGYREVIAGLEAVTDFDDIFILRDPDENLVLYSPAANGNYVFQNGVWTEHSELPSIPGDSIVTTAYVAGHTYVFLQNTGCYEYDFVNEIFVEVDLIGIDEVDLIGITSGSGFLIAYDEFTVYRGQAVNTTDFTPDPSLGSGSSIPEELKGKIVFCAPISNGFIIYTTQNAVGASFSQNIRFPFIYKEVRASAGIKHPRHVTWQDNVGEHYAWTEAGLQKLDKSQAVLVFANITDFLTSKLYEDFDTTTNAFVLTEVGTVLKIRLAMVAKRYLCISYGLPTSDVYTFALIYDLAYKRLGKAKLDHRAIFELSLPVGGDDVPWEDLDAFIEGGGTWTEFLDTTWEQITNLPPVGEQPREILAFLQADGTIQVANFDSVHTNDSGVLILGKYQFVRERWITLEEIALENINQNYNYSLRLLTSYDGKNIDQVSVPYLNQNFNKFRHYLSNVQGKNQSLAAVGTFHLACLELMVKIEGRV